MAVSNADHLRAARKLRYRVFLLTAYSIRLLLEEALSLQAGDIDAGRKKCSYPLPRCKWQS